MKFHRLLLLLSIASIHGCSTTGGTSGGQFPAPKFLQGTVENDTYYAKDGSFEVKTPYEQDSHSYKYMAIKEQYAKTGAHVSFTASNHPNEFYRVEIGRKLDQSQPSPAFELLVEGLLQGYKQQLTGYGSHAREQWRTETTLDGKQAMLVTLVQSIPPRHGYQGSSPGYTAHHIIYIVQSPSGGGASVWVQWPHACNACSSGPESAILSTDPGIRSFIKSFELKL